jgi:hypothetical protein
MTFRRLSHGRDKLSETKPRRRRRAGPQLIHNSLARFPLTTTTPGHVKNVFFQKNIYWGGSRPPGLGGYRDQTNSSKLKTQIYTPPRTCNGHFTRNGRQLTSAPPPTVTIVY